MHCSESCPGLDGENVSTVTLASNHDRDSERHHTLFFFIPGNPGLIDYYIPFFTALRSRFDRVESQNSRVALHIHSENLIGFADEDHEPFEATDQSPFDLSAQIKHFVHRMSDVRRHGKPYDRIVICGHSVGAYISLEVFDRHSKLSNDAQCSSLSSGILLFPTVSHLAQSSNGKKLEKIRTISFLDRNAHWIAKRFVDLVPASFLGFYIRQIMGFSHHAAEATLKFLQSRDGIWQALHLGKDELRTIKEDTWSEDLWEISDSALAEKHDVTKFFFYFGEKDHWVADEFRDAFIRSREEHGRREGPKHKQGKTQIMIDQENIPHAFCIRKMLVASSSKELSRDADLFFLDRS